MEAKPGYKLTEAGVIPEGWEVKSVGQIGNPVRGGSPRPAGDPRYFNGAFIPWLTVAALTNLPSCQSEVTETETCLTAEGSLHSRTLNPGTLIIANSGATLGVAKILRIKCCANDGIAAVLDIDDGVSPTYLAHLINARTTYLRNVVATGNGQPNLNTELISALRLPIPPTRAEQEAIADALTHADAVIESLEQLIAKKRNLKQGAMQELLTGKNRLPGLRGQWHVRPLGEIGESLIGLTYKPSDVRDTGTLVLRSSNVFEGALKFDDNVFVDADVPERIIVREGDILICVRNGSRELIGKCAKIYELPQKTTFGAFMAVFRTPHHGFVYHQLQSDVIKRQIHEHLGATINQITNKSLNSFRIPFPADEAEQTAIGNILSDMDAEIAALEAKLAKARQIKQGMMQNLLTGRIRLV